MKRNKTAKIWRVMYKKRKSNDWNYLDCQEGFWYADPILINFYNNKYLFTEAFDMKKQIGRIAVSKYINGKFSKPTIIIKKLFHMSYPCVFDYDGNLYMIPETGQNGRLELWKCVGNITEWKKYCTLLKGIKLADTTVYKDNNIIYLVAYEEDKTYVTHIYKLDILEKKLNEIERINNSHNNKRPAGKFFNYEKKIYRPVQNNIKDYGESILINEILSLHPFKEREVKELKSDFFTEKIKGKNTHTLSFDDELIVVDYLDDVNIPFYYRIILIRKIRNFCFKIRFKLINKFGGKHGEEKNM